MVFCLIGLLGGMFGGLLGIGGGSAIAPLLLLTTTLRPAQVSGTTLATVLAISAVGTGTYASLGHLNLEMAWPIAAGSIIGAVLGALSARGLSVRVMAGVLLAILPYFALKEFWPSIPAPAIPMSVVALGLLGFATGFLSGLLGIGGASLVVPSLVGFFLLDHIAAQGIAMSVAIADSAAGVATHARARNVDYRALIYLIPPAVFAAVAAAFLSHYLPDWTLRYLFGAFLVTVWTIMLARWIDETNRSRPVSRSVPFSVEKREETVVRTPTRG